MQITTTEGAARGLRAQIDTPCPDCHAEAGYWCHTPTGRLRAELHGKRYWAAMDRLKAERVEADRG